MVANNPTKLRPVAYATESAAARGRSSGDTAVSRYGRDRAAAAPASDSKQEDFGAGSAMAAHCR